MFKTKYEPFINYNIDYFTINNLIHYFMFNSRQLIVIKTLKVYKKDIFCVFHIIKKRCRKSTFNFDIKLFSSLFYPVRVPVHFLFI